MMRDELVVSEAKETYSAMLGKLRLRPFPFDGAVLAGGNSARMGRVKADLKIAGESLLERQLRLLRETGATRRIVSAHPQRRLDRQLEPDIVVTLDENLDAGPMAGLERVLSLVAHQYVLVLAVDLPRLTIEFLRRLTARISFNCGVVPLVDHRLEPLVTVYPRTAYPFVVQSLARKEFGLQRLARSGLEAGWLQAWELDPADVPLVTNWNNPEDFCES